MPIGYVCETSAGRGGSDVVLACVVARLQAKGVRLAGTVQTNLNRPDRVHCDMDVRVLPDGPSFRISQDLGNHAKGCRLDPGALEQAVALAALGLPDAEVLVVNKFGKLESAGRGFCSLIAEAIVQGVPVLVGVNQLNLPQFQAFALDLATPLGSDPSKIVDWALALRAKSTA